jgi:hypothetical protein
LRLAQQHVQHVVAIKVALLAEDGFVAVVMQIGAVDKLEILVQRPAGKGAGGFADVLFAVMAFAQGKQLHHFAGKVFIGLALAVIHRVQIAHHGRVAGNGVQ